MLRRRNRRKAQRPKRQWQLPAVDWRRVILGVASSIVVAAVYVSTVWLMNRPIEEVVIRGAFERVSAMQLQEALAGHVRTGFLSANLDQIRREATDIPWVATARVRRVWPGTVEVTVAEEQPAACWGERGLLNMEGELFVTDSSHIPAELPRLHGPAGSERQVARQYFLIEQRLEQRGLAAVALDLDARGAWTLQLNNGVQVRLGARDIDQRLERFFVALDQAVTMQVEQVEYVDMRYTNGFAIGWKGARAAGSAAGKESDPNV